MINQNNEIDKLETKLTGNPSGGSFVKTEPNKKQKTESPKSEASNFMQKLDMNDVNLKKLDEKLPVEQGNLDYFSEYIKLFFANVVLTTQLKELYSEREVLVKKLGVLESEADKKKRKRKKKDEVERNFRCMVDGCGKAYGSENSLNQHYKLKHEELWQKQKLACPELAEKEAHFQGEDMDSSDDGDPKKIAGGAD